MKHLLDFQNIQKKEMENLIEEILKVDLYKLNQIKSFTLLQFNENSTRTRLSFAIAAKRLGIDIVESTDNISAKSKGEGLMHELETYQSMGIETVVIRSSENNIEDYKNYKEVAIISGGFGNSSHPTQALVDAATLMKLGKFNYDIPVTYVGDLKHSRVFSSGRELLNKLGFKVGVFTNEELFPENTDGLNIFNSWDEVIGNSGSIELLRVQKERIENLSNFNFEKYKKHFQLSNEVLSQTPPDFAVFHPMPINIGIEIDEIAAKNEKFKYGEQLKFAIPARIISYRYALGNI